MIYLHFTNATNKVPQETLHDRVAQRRLAR